MSKENINDKVFDAGNLQLEDIDRAIETLREARRQLFDGERQRGHHHGEFRGRGGHRRRERRLDDRPHRERRGRCGHGGREWALDGEREGRGRRRHRGRDCHGPATDRW